jgi:hypothetical protein
MAGRVIDGTPLLIVGNLDVKRSGFPFRPLETETPLPIDTNLPLAHHRQHGLTDLSHTADPIQSNNQVVEYIASEEWLVISRYANCLNRRNNQQPDLDINQIEAHRPYLT